MDPNGLFVRGFDADTLGTVIADKIRETMARFRVKEVPCRCKPDLRDGACHHSVGKTVMNYDAFFLDAINQLGLEFDRRCRRADPSVLRTR